jgi:hypothetical protein
MGVSFPVSVAPEKKNSSSLLYYWSRGLRAGRGCGFWEKTEEEEHGFHTLFFTTHRERDEPKRRREEQSSCWKMERNRERERVLKELKKRGVPLKMSLFYTELGGQDFLDQNWSKDCNRIVGSKFAREVKIFCAKIW